MGTVPTVHTWANGDKPNFRDMNSYLEDPFNFLMNPPMVRLRKTTVQAVPHNTFTAVSWDYVEVETVNFWDSANPTKLTPSVPGYYIGSFGWSFVGNATSYRAGQVIKNSSGTVKTMVVHQDAYTNATYTEVSRGNVFFEQFNGTTDYITIELFQVSGGSLNIETSIIDRQPDVTLRWFAP